VPWKCVLPLKWVPQVPRIWERETTECLDGGFVAKGLQEALGTAFESGANLVRPFDGAEESTEGSPSGAQLSRRVPSCWDIDGVDLGALQGAHAVLLLFRFVFHSQLRALLCRRELPVWGCFLKALLIGPVAGECR
jgi:hypothetical protein